MTGITSMGTTLLIGSCEPFSGKSALVLGIAQQLASETIIDTKWTH